ncbi:MAG: lactate racemase domain-containing protein [Phycisphaerae bacterium]|nr:lactate racemase domain-containing protein [Phycisphaerae bacterium]
MADIQVPWGTGKLSVPIPSHWKLVQVAEPALRPAPEDWPERLAMALQKPVAGEPLSNMLAAAKDGKITLVVDPPVPQSPLGKIIEIVLREIRHAGIADEQLEIVFATGSHPPVSPDKVEACLGPAAEGIAWRTNPWSESHGYIHLGRIGKLDVQIDRGVVESDLRIVISSVSPHLRAGFSGGYKMFLPGCAHLSSIRVLRRQGVSRKWRQLVGADAGANPVRATTDAAGAMVDAYHGNSFSIQYLLDGENNPVSLAAGEPMPTYQMVSKQCAVACGIMPERPADVLIANAYPRDRDPWQCFKCISNTCRAARPDGVIICLAGCHAGLDEIKPMYWPLKPAWTRKLLRLLGPEATRSLTDRFIAPLAGDFQKFIRLTVGILQRNHLLMVSPTMAEKGMSFPGITMFYSVADALAAAEKILGRGPQRVAVYPAGGVSYPVMRNPKSVATATNGENS